MSKSLLSHCEKKIDRTIRVFEIGSSSYTFTLGRMLPVTNGCYYLILLKKSVRPNGLNIGR
jgi:hypothetical protein